MTKDEALKLALEALSLKLALFIATESKFILAYLKQQNLPIKHYAKHKR